MIAFKIVTVKADKTLTGLYNYLSSSLMVDYIPDGSVITPKLKNSLLYVFNDKDIALTWMRKDTQLWEVECDSIEKIEDSVCLPNDEEVNIFWTGKRTITISGKSFCLATYTPDNLYGCKSLKMIKQIA
jgi:hypothetical protein